MIVACLSVNEIFQELPSDSVKDSVHKGIENDKELDPDLVTSLDI